MTVQNNPASVDFDDGIAQWLKQYKQAKEEINRWEEVMDIARSHLESAMGDAEVALYENKPVIRWTRFETRRFDATKARQILPQQVLDVLEIVSSSRRFVVVEQDEK